MPIRQQLLRPTTRQISSNSRLHPFRNGTYRGGGVGHKALCKLTVEASGHEPTSRGLRDALRRTPKKGGQIGQPYLPRLALQESGCVLSEQLHTFLQFDEGTEEKDHVVRMP